MNRNEALEDLRGEDLGKVIKKPRPWGQEELCVLIEVKNRLCEFKQSRLEYR